MYQSLKTKIRAHFTDEGIKRGTFTTSVVLTHSAAGKVQTAQTAAVAARPPAHLLPSANHRPPCSPPGDHKCDAAAWARYTLFTFMFCVSTYAWLQGEWWSLIGMPWFYWLGPSGLMHSGSHSALSKIPWVNRAGAYAGSAHVSALHWYHQHVIGHHCHTNIEGYDPDLTHFQHEEDASPGYRLHADQPWFDKYDTWRSAMPMQAFFSSSGPALLNQPLYLMAQKFGCTPVLNQSPLRTLWHILGRLAIIYAAFVHPFRIFELQKAFFFAAFPYGFHGMIFFGFSQVSHLNEDLMEAQLDIPMARKREWAAHQILTCCDYNTDSLLWRTLSIGLNAQAIHHLFPGIEPCHYGPLSQMLKDTCEEHNLPYTNVSNYDDYPSIGRIMMNIVLTDLVLVDLVLMDLVLNTGDLYVEMVCSSRTL